LPEHGIDAVFHNGGKPCPAAIIKQGGQAKILFDNVSFFGDGFVSGDFGFGKASVDIVFSHDVVGDFVHGKKVSIRGAGIALVGIDDIDFLIGVHAVDGGIGQIGRVAVGGRGEGGRQNQSIFHIDGGMLFQAEMGEIVFDGPVGFKIAGEFFGIAVFIQVAVGAGVFVAKLGELIV